MPSWYGGEVGRIGREASSNFLVPPYVLVCRELDFKGMYTVNEVGLKEAWNFKEEKTGGRKLLPLEHLSSLFLHE